MNAHHAREGHGGPQNQPGRDVSLGQRQETRTHHEISASQRASTKIWMKHHDWSMRAV